MTDFKRLMLLQNKGSDERSFSEDKEHEKLFEHIQNKVEKFDQIQKDYSLLLTQKKACEDSKYVMEEKLNKIGYELFQINSMLKDPANYPESISNTLLNIRDIAHGS